MPFSSLFFRHFLGLPLAAFLCAALCGSPASADIEFTTSLFADGMVLQADAPVELWGTASPGESITISIQGQEHVIAANGAGEWSATLDPLTTGGPTTLTLEGNKTVVLSNVLVGQVWVCSGQSNMELAFPTPDEMAAYPQVRTWRMKAWGDTPSAVCFGFGSRLSDALGVPIGLVANAASGSKIRNWLGPDVASDPNPAVAPVVDRYPDWGRLWDQRVAPIIPFTVRGVAWWQGESDRREPGEHAFILPAMIRSWRIGWGLADLPFVFVQLPTGKGMQLDDPVRRLPRTPRENHRNPLLRQAFVATTSSTSDTTMIITGDLRGGTHPPKRTYFRYSDRLGDAALAQVYGMDFTYTGPQYETVTAEPAGRVRIAYQTNTAPGLVANGDGPLQGFAVTDDFVTWHWANAEIQGEEVVVWNDEILNPIGVRYGYGKRFRWANLFNEADMGAAPFEATVDVP